MKKTILIGLLVLVSSLIMWLPFVAKLQIPGWNLDFSEGSKILWQNFDGPNYLIISKTWYNKADIMSKFSSPLPAEYYPAHFPLYPVSISIFNMFFRGPWAMLISTLVGSILCFLMFYKYIKDFNVSRNAIWLTLVFLIFPARWLAVRTVGSPEPWFLFFILSSLYFFKKGKYFYAGILGALAQLTKSPGILLFAAYGVYFLMETFTHKKIQWKMWPMMTMVAVVPLLFWFYAVKTGDFWAYFHSGDNFHLFWPPFSVFSPKGEIWVGNFWLEDVIYTWLIFGLGVLHLRDKKLTIEHYFSGIFFLSTLFVAHRDISRYILPIAPFMLMGWDEIIQKREFKIIAAVLIIPIVLYNWNFLMNNIAPISDWAPYL